MRYSLIAVLLIGCTMPMSKHDMCVYYISTTTGLALGGLVVTGAYVSDSLVNLPHKCGGDKWNYAQHRPVSGPGQGECFINGNGGEPLQSVFAHHVNTTNNVMMLAGIPATLLGMGGGYIAGEYLCGQ